MKLRIGVVGDQQLVVEGICRLIENDFDLAGASNCEIGALELAADSALDAMLLDISLPLLNGLELAHKMKDINPFVRIIFVTAYDDKEYVRKAFEAGASGYVSKLLPIAELSLAIREVARGRLFISSTILRRFCPEECPLGEINPARFFTQLTIRQREVVHLVAEGCSSREIALRLQISWNTVKHHKQSLMRALNLRSSAQLIRYCVQSELMQG